MQRISLLPVICLFVSSSALALPAHPWAIESSEIPHRADADEIPPGDDDEVPSLPTPEPMRRERPSYPSPEQMRRERPSYPSPEQMRREQPSMPTLKRPQHQPPLPLRAPRVKAKAPRARTHVVVLSAQEARVWHLLNSARRARGLAPLRVDPIATRVARAHSADMCRRGYFSHRDPNGGRPWTRLAAAGARFSAAAENIASGYPNAFAAHQGWMQSAGHRHNRMNPRYRRMGVGVARCGQTLYWTELFLR